MVILVLLKGTIDSIVLVAVFGRYTWVPKGLKEKLPRRCSAVPLEPYRSQRGLTIQL